MTDANACPTCRQPAVAVCRCPLGDSRCARGHLWHHCPGCGVVVTAPSNHAADTFGDANKCPACRAKPEEKPCPAS